MVVMGCGVKRAQGPVTGCEPLSSRETGRGVEREPGEERKNSKQKDSERKRLTGESINVVYSYNGTLHRGTRTDKGCI